ncbi:M55 family metallopeptidase [Cohnella fermenti]|uniref:Aminopeptidase n=1 Tax=Cohnella fermenti TaxID=2565925 RepID=A0A4S4BGL5_9BACL|nr:M55 family metallopeptidase [Cohnella fermenti]THF73594.1 hypothetical protein E6C55_28335 [Cohnella fermenti]
MKWMVRVDMEGVTGVVRMNQVIPGASEYSFGQRMMMHDLHALLGGLLQRPEDEVVLYDIHFFGTNIDLEALGPNVTAICGKPHYTPDNGSFVDESFDGLILLGLHAKAGMPDALLAHSYEHDITHMDVNGLEVGEIGLEALMAGESGVPLVMVTADSEGAAEAERLVPNVVTAVTKLSLSGEGAACYPPSRTAELLRAGAMACVQAVKHIRPLCIEGPIRLEMRLKEGDLLRKLHDRIPEAFLTPNRLALNGDSVIEAWRQYLTAKS